MKTEPDFAELPTEAQGRIDDVCDAFERAWQAAATAAGGTAQGLASTPGGPTIDTFLERLSENERTAALHELVPIDISYRRRSGAAVEIGEYARFTELDVDWLAGIVLNPDGATRQLSPSSALQTKPALPPKLPPPTREVFVERLVLSGVLDRPTVEREIATLSEPDTSTTALGEHLVSRGLLTPFQFSSLLRSHKPGLLLGEYVILSPLGRGGMGAVYRARHRRMDRIVALKVLPSAAAHDPQAASRFDREIRAIARLSHPNIVVAHDAGEDAGVAYLVMECIDGTDLSSCVRTHGPLSVAHAVECLAQAAEGLEYAHRQGVIHRDIKPSNLVLCHNRTGPATGNVSGATGGSFGPPVLFEDTGGPKPPPVAPDQDSRTIAHHDGPRDDDSPHAILPTALRVKVLDLGLARFNADAAATKEGSALTHSGVMFGTPEYMSPEQAVSASSADARSDIYSLGCTLYFLLTGRTVVVGESFLETVMAHQLQSLPSLSAARDDVPAELEQIFRRMTARRPEQRFASMHDVRDALRAIPAELLPRVPSPVRKTDAPRKTPARETAVSGNPATDWLSPLDHDDQRAATVLITDLDVPSVVRRRLSPQSRIIEWAKSNRTASLTLAAVTIGLLIAAAVWWGTQPGDRASLAGRDNPANRNAAPQTPPKVPRPEVLTCPATTTLVQQRQREWAEFLGTPASIKNSIGIMLCLIPPGEFTMGTSDEELQLILSGNVPDYDIKLIRREQLAHRVQLTKPFWIGQTEITVGQFRKFVDAEHYVTETEKTEGFGFVNNRWVLSPGYNWQNVGDAKISENHPASNLTWNDAVAFCNWLSRHESRESGKDVHYRLPTEAEWEYACRAGTDTPWYFGSDPRTIQDHAVMGGNAGLLLHPVGTKLDNAFHLFDVSGNQSEWCQDWFAPYGSADATDPTGPLNGRDRVQRGGNFGDQPVRLRSASRQSRPPTSPRDGSVRVVRDP